MRVLPSERLLSNTPAGASDPVPESKGILPPVIHRAEVVAFALVALLIISIVAVLYVAKAFFLPVVMAFIVGTMLSPAASFLERYRIPRPIGAVVIVGCGRRRGHLHGWLDLLPAGGVEHAATGGRRAAKGQVAHI